MKIIRLVVLSVFCLAAASCSPVLEATRPDPVDLDQFVVGESRMNVLAELGNPVATQDDDNSDNSCDIYKLYTHGPEAVGKGAIAAGEAAADVVTLGLAEVLFTPVEAATRNSKHTVIFCYNDDKKLVSVKESDSKIDN